MTVSSENRQAGPYDGDGVVVDFPFAFKVFSTSDVKVVYADADGAETVWALTTDYTVSLNVDQDANPGGTVTAVAAPASLTTLTLTSQVQALQPTDLTNQGGFYPKVISNALDRLTILVQQALNSIGRTITVPISTPTTFNAELPIPTANRAVFTNDAGDGFELRDAGSVDLAVPADSSVTTAKIDDLAVTGAKIADVAVTVAKMSASATDVLFGRSTAGAGAGEEIPCTAAGRALLDDANATAQRATLGAAASGAATGSGITMATARMLGRTTASTGAIEEISVGAGLSLSGGALVVGSGGVVGKAYGEYSAYQRVSSVIPIDDTVPTSSEGTEIISVSYTPTDSSDKIRLTATVGGVPSVTAAVVALFSGTTCVDAKIFAHSSVYGSTALVVEFAAGTTSITAYSMRVGVDPAGYVDINADFAGNRVFGGKSLCTLLVEEIKA